MDAFASNLKLIFLLALILKTFAGYIITFFLTSIYHFVFLIFYLLPGKPALLFMMYTCLISLLLTPVIPALPVQAGG